MQGAGGTSGGAGEFFLGLAMAVGGPYLFTSQATVTFGLSLLPLVVGCGFLFFDGRSRLGLLLAVLGALVVLLGVLVNLRVYFEPTSLFNTLLMLFLLAGGLGLLARGLRPHA